MLLNFVYCTLHDEDHQWHLKGIEFKLLQLYIYINEINIFAFIITFEFTMTNVSKFVTLN